MRDGIPSSSTKFTAMALNVGSALRDRRDRGSAGSGLSFCPYGKTNRVLLAADRARPDARVVSAADRFESDTARWLPRVRFMDRFGLVVSFR